MKARANGKRWRGLRLRPGSGGWVAGQSLLSAVLLLLVVSPLLAQQAVFTPTEPTAVGPETAAAEMVEELARTIITEFVTLEYTKTPAEDVVDAICRTTGQTIVWGEEAERGEPPKKSTRITVQARNIPWRDGLRMVLGQIGGVIIEETPSRVLIDTPQPITAVWVEDDLKFVIETIGRLSNASIIVGPQVEGTVTARVVDQPWTKALEDVVRTAGFAVVREANVIRVVHPATLTQQLVTQVFKLKYVLPPDTYRPTMDSEYLSGGPVSRSDARRALTGMGAGQPVFTGQLGVPAAPARAAGRGAQVREVEFPLFDAVQRVLTPGIGQVTYDPDRNALIVTDTEPALKQLEGVLARIDTEPEQVFVDVKFVTVGGPAGEDYVTDLMQFGVDWTHGLTASHTGPTNLWSGMPLSARRPGMGLAGSSRGYTIPGGPTPGILDFSQLITVLQLLKSDASSEIVQAPKLTVLDHHEATIFVGGTVRFAEQHATTNQAGGLEISYEEATNSPVDTGFQILIVPHIVPGTDKVIVTLIPERNTLEVLEGFPTPENPIIRLPQITSDTVVTKMLLRDKQTAVIGGLVDESEEETVRKVPFLGDIPLLGWAFKYQRIEKIRRNLIIFVTVHIIRRSEDSRDIYRVYEDYDLVSAEYFTPWDLRRRRRLEQEAAGLPAAAAVPAAKEAGWRRTEEGIEYSVPAKGAKEGGTPELELAP